MDDDESRPTGGTPAAEALEARLVEHAASPLRRFVRGVAAVAVSAVGGDGMDLLPGYDVLVTRRDTGAEVMRVRGGPLDEADRLLQLVRDELRQMTVVAFIRSWRVVDGPDDPGGRS